MAVTVFQTPTCECVRLEMVRLWNLHRLAVLRHDAAAEAAALWDLGEAMVRYRGYLTPQAGVPRPRRSTEDVPG